MSTDPTTDPNAAARNLLGAHVQAQDAGRAADVAALYLQDAVLQMPGADPFAGRDAIRAAYEGWSSNRPQKHLVGNTTVRQVSETELAVVSDVVYFQRGDDGWSVMVVGQYDDTLRLHDGRWHFALRAVQFTS